MENRFFPEIHGKLAFGCMRLPEIGDKPDLIQTIQMVDAFLDAGFNYFDTAHGYHNGQSELALRSCLTSRHDRSEFLLTNKLTAPYFKSEDEIRPFFENQLAWCGVDYFDFYLMHAQDRRAYEHFKRCRAYETAFALKAEGKVRHVGLSFHDRAEVLDQILTDYPQVEVVQIQLNYLDWDSPAVESAKCYEVCVKHNKPVLVMEPVKGGHLVQLPAEAQAVFDALGGGYSNAAYALRYCASFPQVAVVLSGMSNLDQIRDNVAVMGDFKPLDAAERAAVEQVCAVFAKQQMIPCTACHYCVYDSECPKHIKIPELFASYNRKALTGDWNEDAYYRRVLTAEGGKASDCIECGKCEKTCPQHLEIRKYLKDVAEKFERK